MTGIFVGEWRVRLAEHFGPALTRTEKANEATVTPGVSHAPDTTVTQGWYRDYVNQEGTMFAEDCSTTCIGCRCPQ
ncbi:hypothetical protein ACFU7Y_30630 [Kitasatospora sp. NPDC057542]|uniref:hypothetical protein n=1 Tax=Kitasatospora sp. NPDC057542 TaxID=3346162 RepID=UPI0036A59093